MNVRSARRMLARLSHCWRVVHTSLRASLQTDVTLGRRGTSRQGTLTSRVSALVTATALTITVTVVAFAAGSVDATR